MAVPAFGQGNLQEYLLKAGFIERFTRFIEFPDSILPSHLDSVFIIGVIGDDPFNGVLESFFQDNTIKDHIVEIKHFDNINEVKNCHLLFISYSKQEELPEIMEFILEYPIVTVGDTKNYAKEGVMINFYIEQNKMRFEINLKTVEKSGLKISHLLLKAARPVK
ncbi:MAG: YfiR family protein [Bacteroidales bacterium]|nr:YfiR family protein [Bacteroidales bacterium]